jgi:hypothetical protein
VTGNPQLVTIGVRSADFDPSAILMDAKGSFLVSDGNSGGGSNALIQQALDPGNYYIVIKPASDPSSAGSYSVNVDSSDIPPTTAARRI